MVGATRATVSEVNQPLLIIVFFPEFPQFGSLRLNEDLSQKKKLILEKHKAAARRDHTTAAREKSHGLGTQGESCKN